MLSKNSAHAPSGEMTPENTRESSVLVFRKEERKYNLMGCFRILTPAFGEAL